MKIQYTKITESKEYFDVDDRNDDDESEVWRIANILLYDNLNRMISGLYNNENCVSNAAQINEAFKQADKILKKR